MNLKYKKNILFALKWSGFFSAAKKLTRKGLRILCFHGISDNDEVLWRPGLYIKTEQFKQRLNYLCHNHFPVFELDNAFELLQKNKLPPNSTVITIDDGFYNTISNGDPLLYYYRFPYTVYVSSYYSQKESPLFNLSVSYMLWKTSLDDINFSCLGINLPASKIKKTDKKFSSVENTIIQFGQGLKKQSERDDIIKKLGDLLAVDTDCLVGERKLSIMNRFEIKKISSKGGRHTASYSQAHLAK